MSIKKEIKPNYSDQELRVKFALAQINGDWPVNPKWIYTRVNDRVYRSLRIDDCPQPLKDATGFPPKQLYMHGKTIIGTDYEYFEIAERQVKTSTNN